MDSITAQQSRDTEFSDPYGNDLRNQGAGGSKGERPRMKRLVVVVSLLSALAMPGRLACAQESVDLLLHSGKIFTADERLSTFPPLRCVTVEL